MKLERSALLSALEIAAPALATKEVIEQLCCFWFDGEQVIAYNEGLAIVAPFKSQLLGGIKGALMLGVLQNSRAKEVEIIATENVGGGVTAELKAGRARLKLALLDTEGQPFHFPELRKSKPSSLSASVLEALKAVKEYVGKGTAIPEQLGVTISRDSTQVHLYTFDDVTISWKSAAAPRDWFDETVIIPTFFVEQLVRLADDKTQLYLTKDAAIAITGKGVKIYAPIVEPAKKPYEFQKVAKEHLKQSDLVEIPNLLRLALERASVVLDGQKDNEMEMYVEKDRKGNCILRLHAITPAGELNDRMTLEKQIPETSCKVNPTLLKRALEQCDRIGFSDRAVIMQGERLMYLTSTTSVE